MKRPGRWRTEALGFADLVIVRRNGRAVTLTTTRAAASLVGACRLVEAVLGTPSPRPSRSRPHRPTRFVP